MRRLLCACGLWGLIPFLATAVDFSFPVVKTVYLPATPRRYFQMEDTLVMATGESPRALTLDLRTLDIALFPIDPINYVFGFDRRGVAVEREGRHEGAQAAHLVALVHELHSGVTLELSEGLNFSGGSLTYYQNDAAFYALRSGSGMELSLLNMRTGTNRGLGWRVGYAFELPSVISRDKQSLLVNDYRTFYAYHPTTQDRAALASGMGGGPLFLTNTLVLLRPRSAFVLYDIAGTKVDELGLLAANGFGNGPIWFSNDLRYGILLGRLGGYGVDAAIVDATPLRDWLDGLGLLYHPTTAVASAPGVRVRENANLEAYVYGELSQGDQVAVLDRSGIKEKIGAAEDWWYRVRRDSDGLQGWAFGAYLDLKDKQGDLLAH